jgi:hypothetical protein
LRINGKGGNERPEASFDFCFESAVFFKEKY